ncbi:DUF6282 family protein [Legionella pneumophila]|uniref:Amidohydrolase-related domain-containing protein n=1 Tax=Legionella pneumophila (strain Lens) TaxID=297245 RepID=Q5WTB4_LEGPL|nr:DUF6282 family protein [Legionella pneumophila]AOW53554.1 hypothetical protein BE841_14350 [Legionella pneumophila subsp. pneumophila]AOW55551.1 hypothetical protein BE842_09290 [Legionella pneumophila subsp. pneumophila]AOW58892.1 hypothetical protein BE843_11820 [Legionella pneumophila subsp. pneumophila]AOW60920.1 hypothetical protein BE844_06950 [Legionella pneumophila subsp. pneumophila]AOW64352.1 hypothetical protein BE845_09925 [Legionella pneumophila subsp. pneumophila]
MFLPEKLKFIDIHYHAAPDLYIRRRNAIEAGRLYHSLCGTVVLKNHIGSTGIQATIAQEMGLPVFPSVVLNHINGGINYRVVIRALSEYQPLFSGKMIVDFPTITGRKLQSKLSRELTHNNLKQYTRQGETLFGSKQQLRKEVIDILKMARDYPIVLTSGLASREEIYRLIDACNQYDVPSLLLSQPSNPLIGLKFTELNELIKNEWLWVEQTALTFILEHQDKQDFSHVLTHIPRVIYSSDLGQTSQMDIPEWLYFSKRIFNELGLSAKRMEELFLSNAIKLLDL